MEKIKRFLKEEEGLELSEYAVMAALVILVAVGTIIILGTKIDAVFKALTDAIPVPS
jgi:Flp pilus assembly pilin Flp